MQAALIQWSLAAVLASVSATGVAADHVAIKRAVDLPPSADLSYTLQARQKGITLGGDGVVNWRADEDKYSVSTQARASLLGKILESRSEGAVDPYGLAPASWYEKRFRKDPNTTTFDRAGKRISFSVGEKSFPILGGEQDRASAQWQMVAVARAAPAKLVAGSEWKFFVAGRRDAEQWTFKVVGREKIQTGLGALETVHLIKSPPADYPEQRLDLWLAPSKEWYPVKLKLSEDEDEFVEQTLTKITPR